MANVKKYKESMTIHMRIEVETVGKLDKIALDEDMGVSRTDIINRAINAYLKLSKS